ncbi:MAG TPA: NADH-quinone oxidoreductase subunit NuoH [Anaerolineales bacterium]|nr:NADH-quinone oxidoreductase subunit NuoH [Anaerolineales bacterium]HRF47203.1 NADH-quinone oxidoreductase subunit NuoH [Anaerolineales bacterium]
MTIDWTLLIEWTVKSAISIAVMLAGFAYMTWAERKVAAKLQTRIGPNRRGPFGLLFPVADGLKLIFKEETMPIGADKWVFILAPMITVVPALVVLAVVPWGPSIEVPWRTPEMGPMPLGLADLNVGIMYILSVTSIAVYGVALGGWASNNKYATLGGLRASAQMIAYEIPLGLSMIGVLMLAGSMSMGDIVAAQSSMWFVAYQPLAALIFYIAGLAETNRAPFDMPEAEQELTAGFHTEYGGMKFAMFFMAEYVKMIGVSAIFTTMFLGGWQGPFVEQVPLLGIVYFWGKTIASLIFMIWVRSTLPRLRYDRLMAFGWKVLLPLALANVVFTAAVLVGRNEGNFLAAGIVTAILVLIVIVVAVVAFSRKRERPVVAPKTPLVKS